MVALNKSELRHLLNLLEITPCGLGSRIRDVCFHQKLTANDCKEVMQLLVIHLFKSEICNLTHTTYTIRNKSRKCAGTDNGHPERAFFQKFETFGLGQTIWAEILGGISAISSQTIGTILVL